MSRDKRNSVGRSREPAYSSSRGRKSTHLNVHFLQKGQQHHHYTTHERVLSMTNRKLGTREESPFMKNYKEHPPQAASNRLSKSPIDNDSSYFEDYNMSNNAGGDFLPFGTIEAGGGGFSGTGTKLQSFAYRQDMKTPTDVYNISSSMRTFKGENRKKSFQH